MSTYEMQYWYGYIYTCKKSRYSKEMHSLILNSQLTFLLL